MSTRWRSSLITIALLAVLVVGYNVYGDLAGRIALEWATTQINLGSALLVLGERESGTMRLDEAVGAYREALRELTYEHAPSLWAIAVGSQGVALMYLAERRADAALAEGALNLINTAVELMRAGGEPSAVAYYERQLATARTSALRLRGPTSR